ncbi:hypothetical protein QRD43_21910 [Pelomonas sp. APW6]|uniref:Uncharacterized protein n=1 Tax=Roseateles subflavus TaxID=3053353 RepID=A0ABT7LNX2_9BURK|nr:hypothetical protein [Pelomonas sp. APW6]MDL5034576.1 hypothetical protein [Pelomonas sp. APW6]
MDTAPYSIEAFERTSSDTFKAELARRLQAAVEAELGPAVREIMSRVAAELNQVGHELAPYGEQTDTESHYRHVVDSDDYKLLLACDVVVTTYFGASGGRR